MLVSSFRARRCSQAKPHGLGSGSTPSSLLCARFPRTPITNAVLVAEKGKGEPSAEKVVSSFWNEAAFVSLFDLQTVNSLISEVQEKL